MQDAEPKAEPIALFKQMNCSGNRCPAALFQSKISDKSLNQHNTLSTAEKGHIYHSANF